MKSTIGLMLVNGLILVSLANCSPSAPLAPEDANTSSSTQIFTAELATMEPQPEMVVPKDEAINGTQVTPALDNGLTESVQLAKQDLAQRLGIMVDDIVVTAVINQEFSTDAFYCRATKERIARDESPQAVSGLSILLNTSGRRYEYHASGRMIIFCRILD